MPVSCGNRRRHVGGEPVTHASAAAVHACFFAEEIFTCGWRTAAVHPEDGEHYEVECGGLSWYLRDGRGYTCEDGHEHIYAEVCHREGWDYAADSAEAGLLAGRGIRPVAMNGGPIDVDPGALRYAMSLPG